MDLSRQEVPRYVELADVLRSELGGYKSGDYLPSETQLAQRFGVNRHTLRRAVDVLIAEGSVLRRKGRGTCVLPRPIVYPVDASSAYSKTLSGMGLRSQAILLGRRRRPAHPDEARDLALGPQEPVLEFQTLRLLDEQPISLITHCFAARHREVLQHYGGGSMRQHLEGCNVRLKRVSTLIGARAPTQRDAAQLLMPRHTPVLSIRTLSSDAAGAPFELACSITRADRFKYHVISGEQHED
ncbi:phosphonate metabolism transcriptional regulator PhnF [Pollutimonas sp. M17]|uniref:phosphonate metabolism transcriptional regulator PhnF n=1 Tax=Pollutimonas sp. M17 TaxID=2962065 RepID=UPI0021F45EAE|nr:phosphonate metabolism transcriptional regulator PhnF [Pollutimonas sp. M17]UYO92307.1 phosphonate metabolism transcriptional regulator PhnF [Pollutimonas sp. M17]